MKKTKKIEDKNPVWMVTKSIKYDPAKLQLAKELGVIHLLAPKSRKVLDDLIAARRKKIN